tara:strand:+ start:1185 stop:1511 length:327 start_codon:yes stop_codon:yes gene_type:complete
MAYNGSQHFRIPRPIVNEDFCNIETITGTKTLTMASSTYQALDNSTVSALTCILPSYQNGATFWVMSTGSQTINVNNPATGATVAAVASGETALFISNGSTWINVFKK